MIAYKGTKNLRCDNLKYEVGKTYIFEGDLELHNRGLHACWDIADVHEYYSFDSEDTVVLEVEIPDDAKIINSKRDSIFVTNKLKVLRILTKEDIEKISDGSVKFDENGRLIFIRYSCGTWVEYEYDKNGNITYLESSTGYWARREYDENGFEIYFEDSDGYREEYKPGELFHCEKCERDEDGNTICYYKDGKGYWEKHVYDQDGIKIYYEDSDGFWMKCEHDHNKVYCKYSNGKWTKREYDENGNEIYYEDSDGYWKKREYDEDGKLIRYEDSKGVKYSIVVQD